MAGNESQQTNKQERPMDVDMRGDFVGVIPVTAAGPAGTAGVGGLDASQELIPHTSMDEFLTCPPPLHHLHCLGSQRQDVPEFLVFPVPSASVS